MNGSDRQSNNRSALLLRPPAVAAVSIAAAALFVLLMLPLPRFAGEQRWNLLIYHAPIVAVFASYLFDRFEHRSRMGVWQWILESFVVVLALSRAVFPIPYVSGHALFLSYVLMTTAFRLTWWLAIAVFAVVVYIKFSALSDLTLIGGVIGGELAGAAAWYGSRGAGRRS